MTVLPVAQLTAARTPAAAGRVVREWGRAAAEDAGPSEFGRRLDALEAAVVALASAAGEPVPLELAHLVPEDEAAGRDEAEVPEVPEVEVPEVDEAEVPEVEVPEVDEAEVPEVEVPEVEVPEVPEVEVPEVDELGTEALIEVAPAPHRQTRKRAAS